jgi:hypothetical protein
LAFGIAEAQLHENIAEDDLPFEATAHEIIQYNEFEIGLRAVLSNIIPDSVYCLINKTIDGRNATLAEIWSQLKTRLVNRDTTSDWIPSAITDFNKLKQAQGENMNTFIPRVETAAKDITTTQLEYRLPLNSAQDDDVKRVILEGVLPEFKTYVQGLKSTGSSLANVKSVLKNAQSDFIRQHKEKPPAGANFAETKLILLNQGISVEDASKTAYLAFPSEHPNNGGLRGGFRGRGYHRGGGKGNFRHGYGNSRVFHRGGAALRGYGGSFRSRGGGFRGRGSFPPSRGGGRGSFTSSQGFSHNSADMHCNKCNEYGHNSRTCQHTQCFSCGEYGHVATDCTQNKEAHFAAHEPYAFLDDKFVSHDEKPKDSKT